MYHLKKLATIVKASFEVPPEPFKDHPSTCGRLRNKPQEKQTVEPSQQYMHELVYIAIE